jgi:hypothetical protein
MPSIIIRVVRGGSLVGVMVGVEGIGTVGEGVRVKRTGSDPVDVGVNGNVVRTASFGTGPQELIAIKSNTYTYRRNGEDLVFIELDPFSIIKGRKLFSCRRRVIY